jgi:hypothetical protein
MNAIAKAIPGRMTKFKLNELSGVTRGAQPLARAVFMKRAEGEGEVDPIIKRAFTDEKRQALATSGAALPDGSFPIETKGDLSNAITAFGRAGDKPKAKAHIIARAKALGASDTLPESWSVSKAGDSADLNPEGAAMSVAIKKALGLAETATDAEVEAAVAKLAVGGDAAAKLAKAEAKNSMLTLLAKARPKDKEQMKATDAEPDADDEPDSPKAKKAIEYLSKSVAERDAIIAKRETGDEVLETAGGSIRKSEVGPGVFAILKSQEERITKGAEEVRKANEINETLGFTKRASDDFCHLAGSIPERVSVLRHVAKADEPTRAAFETIFKAAEATAKLAFTKLGHNDPSVLKEGDPEAQLDKLAKAKQEASNGRLTFEKAYDEVITANPELYAQSVAAKPVAQS